MLYKVVLQPGAEEDIDNAYNWYESQQAGLGEQLLNELASYYKKLAQNPEAFSKANKRFRQAILPRFPYVIIYEIELVQVVVYSVFHTSRSPGKKFRKK